MNPTPHGQDLARQAAQSGTYDSTGIFTIAGKAAVKKLVAFQLPRESAWILKVVQAAVAWGAAEIEIKQGRNTTTFAFAHVGEFDYETLEEALLDPRVVATAYLAHLAVGLRAVGMGQRRSFELCIYQGPQRHTLTWDGEQLCCKSETIAPFQACTVSLRVLFTNWAEKGPAGRSTFAAREARDETLELRKRAAVCPIPLTLDGLRLDLLSAPEPQLRPSYEAELCLAWSAPAQEGHPRLRLPEGIKLAESRLAFGNRLTDWRIFLIDGDPHERASEFLLRLTYYYRVDSVKDGLSTVPGPRGEPDHSWFHWVKDGIVCHSEQIEHRPSPLCLDLYLSAEGLASDPSGLTLILEGAEVIARKRRALIFAQEKSACLKSSVDRHQSFAHWVPRIIGSAATFIGATMVVDPAVMFAVVPGVLGLASLPVRDETEFNRRVREDCQHLLARLDSNLSKTLSNLRRQI